MHYRVETSPKVHAVPQAEALEENLITRLSHMETKSQKVLVKRISPNGKIPTKGTAQTAGYDLSASKKVEIPARNQETIGTGIAIQLPTNTYGRIAPRSGLAVKNKLMVKAGVIDADYRGEISVVLANLGENDDIVNKADRVVS